MEFFVLRNSKNVKEMSWSEKSLSDEPDFGNKLNLKERLKVYRVNLNKVWTADYITNSRFP